MHKLFFMLIATSCIAAGVHGDEFLHNGVTAHRGNSGEFPENTIPAFKSAIELGVDWIELDVFSTADDKLVVIHDRTTTRVGDRGLDVVHSSYAELLTVDVASEFRSIHDLNVEQQPMQTIPLLEDVLRLAMVQDRTRVSIQPKMDCVVEVVALIKRLNCEPWVGFNDGNLTLMAKVKQLAPALPVFWDRGESDVDEDIKIAERHGFEALVLNQAVVTKAKIDKIRGAGLEAGVWTVNSDADLKRFLELGVDRIYTDYPSRLLQLLQSDQVRRGADR